MKEENEKKSTLWKKEMLDIGNHIIYTNKCKYYTPVGYMEVDYETEI